MLSRISDRPILSPQVRQICTKRGARRAAEPLACILWRLHAAARQTLDCRRPHPFRCLTWWISLFPTHGCDLSEQLVKGTRCFDTSSVCQEVSTVIFTSNLMRWSRPDTGSLKWQTQLWTGTQRLLLRVTTSKPMWKCPKVSIPSVLKPRTSSQGCSSGRGASHEDHCSKPGQHRGPHLQWQFRWNCGSSSWPLRKVSDELSGGLGEKLREL